MPATDTSRLARLVAILTQLQTKRVITAPQLAAKFQVSSRTIYRDMRTLKRAGVPLVTEEGRGYSLLAGYRLPPVMFTETEANALVTAEKLVLANQDASFKHAYQEAIAKVNAVLPGGIKQRVSLLAERIAIEAPPAHAGTSERLATIQLALTAGKVIQLTYQSPQQAQPITRLVEPFGLLNRVGEDWYLIGWCRLRQDYRLFRFDRIQELLLTSELFAAHQLTLEKYLQTYRHRSLPLT